MKILLIDDHAMTIEGYCSILGDTTHDYFKAYNCEQVYHFLQSGQVPDMAIVDHNLPAYPEQKLKSGQDCALLIKQYAPDCIIVLITAHEEALVLHKMYQKLLPEALITKGDFTPIDLKKIVEGHYTFPYYSIRVHEALREVRTYDTLIRPTNIEILSYLVDGFKVSQISSVSTLSPIAIQKRINNMLHELNVSDSHELVKLVKKMNLF